MDAHEAEYRQRLQKALGADFELREAIGRGGFGVVYAAWDKRLERDVAVKALRHDLFPTSVVLERFRREAKALAQLRHPHVLPVYEVGDGDGIAFMVMPFIRGETLGDLLRRGARLPMDDALRIIVETARALDAAHHAGIVHRDVKPDNILIEGRDRHAVLSDFGIAKGAAQDTELTAAGVAIGSPQYMSPEQAAAERDVDARSDIYSLGTVAYELLSGRRPYAAASLQRLLVLQATTEPEVLSTVAPSVPAHVVAAVMRALARDPAARFQTASEFANALSASLARTKAPETDSWFARRGLMLFLLDILGAYFTVTQFVLGSTPNEGVRTAVQLVTTPVRFALVLFIMVFLVEFVVTIVRARPGRTDGTWQPAWRATFGQPRWWQAWYPRALRAPDSAWDRMPLSMKLLRSLLWLALAAIPLALPRILGIEQLAQAASAVGMPLPLPVRIMFFIGSLLLTPWYLSVVVVALGTVAMALRSRVPVGDVVRLLFTWRAADWDSPMAAPLRHRNASPSRTEPDAATPAVEPRLRQWLAVAALAAAVVIIAKNYSAGSTRVISIAVLPCENVSGDSTTDYLAEGLSDELRSGLAGLAGVTVKARTSSLVFRGTQPDLARIKSRLGVSQVLECSVRARAGQLAVLAELVDVASGDARWSHTYVGSASSLQAIRDSIREGVTSRLVGRATVTIARGTTDNDAYALFLKGEFQRHRGAFPLAISLLREATRRDPGFARAHGALAAAYANLPVLGYASPESTSVLARGSVARALALDPADPLAHSADGIVAIADLRMADAERAFAAILGRDSSNAEAATRQAGSLAWLGRMDEAVASSRRARRLDPLSPEANTVMAYVLYASRRFEEAIAETRPALELDSNNVLALENLAVAFAFAGHLDSAVAVARRVAALGARDYGGRAYLMFAFAAAGRWDEADTQQRLLAAESGNSPEFNAAFSHLVNGRGEAAVAALERAFQRREPLIAINLPGCDPMWDPLKANPRFLALLAQYDAVPCPALPSWPIRPRPK